MAIEGERESVGRLHADNRQRCMTGRLYPDKRSVDFFLSQPVDDQPANQVVAYRRDEQRMQAEPGTTDSDVRWASAHAGVKPTDLLKRSARVLREKIQRNSPYGDDVDHGKRHSWPSDYCRAAMNYHFPTNGMRDNRRPRKLFPPRGLPVGEPSVACKEMQQTRE
jgi:hypothetical protein